MNVCVAHGGDVSQPNGGTDRVTALTAGLAERGVDVTLVVPRPEDPLPDRLDDVDVHPVDVGPDSGAFRRAMSITGEANRLADRRDARLQLEHSTLAGVGTLRGCSGYVLDMHDLAYPRYDHVDTPVAPLLKRGVRWLERRAVARADHVVVVSEYMRRALDDGWSTTADRIDVLPNGYFPERIASAADVDPIPGRVCFLGTLHPKVDVEAMRAIADLDAVSEVVVVGDGARRDEIDALAAQRDAVRATGRLPDDEAFELLASGQVLINPQTASELQRSSSPVKLFYYAALGRPMVVTAGPTIVTELEEADAAIATADRSSFVSAVEGLLSSPEERERLSANAATAAREFAWERRAERLAAVYERLRGA